MTKINRDVTVNAVEFRRNVGRALSTFRTMRDAGLDVGRGRSEATIAAAAAVRHLFPDVDILAALGLVPEGAQGEARRAAGGDDGQSDGESNPKPTKPLATAPCRRVRVTETGCSRTCLPRSLGRT